MKSECIMKKQNKTWLNPRQLSKSKRNVLEEKKFCISCNSSKFLTIC